MPTAREHYVAGRLDAAIEQLGVELRGDPADAQRRTFLFELLAFAGQYDRAEKQLDVLASRRQQAEAGTLLYRAALRPSACASTCSPPATSRRAPAPRAGGRHAQRAPFLSIADADPRVGARLEVLAGGATSGSRSRTSPPCGRGARAAARPAVGPGPPRHRPVGARPGARRGPAARPHPGAWRHEDPRSGSAAPPTGRSWPTATSRRSGRSCCASTTSSSRCSTCASS
jgi:hypothetical protein